MDQADTCIHIQNLKTLTQAKKHVCDECIKTNSDWVHLRTCQTFGATLCCDASPNKHMTKHYHMENHPVMISSEPGERWIYCYPDENFAEY